MTANNVMESVASKRLLLWIAPCFRVENSVHMIHNPHYHLIHSFIFLSC